MTEDEVRRIVAEMLGIPDSGAPATGVSFQGGVSYKMVGEGVGAAGLRYQYVLVDFSKVRSVGGRKVWWR